MAQTAADKQKTDLRAARNTDLTVLAVSAAVVVASALLHIEPSGAVGLPGIEGVSLPGVCLTKQITGMDCPGCGLTRSFVAMANGQFRRAWGLHRIGPPLLLLALLQIPLRAYALLRGVPCPWRIETWARGTVIWLLLILLWGNWGYNVHTGQAFRP